MEIQLESGPVKVRSLRGQVVRQRCKVGEGGKADGLRLLRPWEQLLQPLKCGGRAGDAREAVPVQ